MPRTWWIAVLRLTSSRPRLVAIACGAAVISTQAVIAIDAAFNYAW